MAGCSGGKGSSFRGKAGSSGGKASPSTPFQVHRGGRGRGAAGDNERLSWEEPIMGVSSEGSWLHGGNKRGSLKVLGYERELG